MSRDPNDLRAEYCAGFVQGKLQAKGILCARDNGWNQYYLTDPAHAFPKQPGPSHNELERAAHLLNNNYAALIKYLEDPATDPEVAHRLKRLLFRMVGIYHCATVKKPAALDLSGKWLPDAAYFRRNELDLGYETPSLTFMDLYYVNASNDLGDVIANTEDEAPQTARPEKCSAFIKRTGNEVTWDMLPGRVISPRQ